jgi:hypothetical protein
LKGSVIQNVHKAFSEVPLLKPNGAIASERDRDSVNSSPLELW